MSQDDLFSATGATTGAEADDGAGDGTAPSAADLASGAEDLDALRAAAAGCTACDLHRDATQTVFGEGPAAGDGEAPERVRVVLVGEQPGDREDVEGRPFVGPAGALLDRALEAAGIDRSRTYVTNAVKHFKWTRGGAGGKRRIHATPNRTEVVACRPWLDAELALLRPDLVVVLGATAAKALLGPSFRVTRDRGRVLEPGADAPSPDPTAPGVPVLATVHPSAVLRADPSRRDEAFDDLVADLRVVAATLAADT